MKGKLAVEKCADDRLSRDGSCDHSPEDCCAKVNAWIDDPLCDCRELPAQLETHLTECPKCAAAIALERCICYVVNPKRPPTPSAEFDAALFERLVIAPEIRPAPVMTWGEWTAVAVVAAGIIALNFSVILDRINQALAYYSYHFPAIVAQIQLTILENIARFNSDIVLPDATIVIMLILGMAGLAAAGTTAAKVLGERL